MADLNINVNVNGEEKLNHLSEAIGRVGDKVKEQTHALADYVNGWTGLGAVFAGLVVSGLKWSDTLKEMRGETDTFKNAQDELSDSLGMFTGAVIDASRVGEIYKPLLSKLTEGFDELTYALTGTSKAMEDYKVEKEEFAIWEKKNLEDIKVIEAKKAEMAKKREAREAKAEENSKKRAEAKAIREAKADADADVRHQKHLSRLDEIVRAELKVLEDKAKADNDAYEAELLRLDAMVDSANAIENVTQEVQKAVEVEREYTQAIEESSSARVEGAKQSQQSTHDAYFHPERGGSYSNSSNGVMDRGSIRDMQEGGYTAVQSVRGQLFNPMQDIMEDIARTNRRMSRGDN